MRTISIAFAMLALCVGAIFIADPAPGQDASSQPVRLVAPFAAGGSADQIARLVGKSISQRLGVTVVVDNRPGAGGGIAAAEVARSAPDGKTFLIGSNGPLVINRAVYPKLPYDPDHDLLPVVALAETPLLLVVRNDLPVKSVSDLKSYADANAAKPLTMGSAGVGNITHLAGEYLSGLIGFKPSHIPFRGSAPAMLAVIAGQVDIMYDALPTSLQQVQNGAAKALAVTTAHRLPELPDIPTTRELGYDVGKVTAWFGMVAPAKTPAAIVAQINAAADAALAEPDMKEKLAAIGFQAIGGSPAEFAAFIRAEVDRWVPLARSLDVKVD
jgi:tripartite-type tricarboxylate transporter receptor subunit TctC